ncbi:MBL fold metallo-hydrolase [Pseudaestuariivita sp.]|uniref:MBL fold metallo-hydrolase n=1 Tax=Pseudaestuariivita sp. TaxID=2211669 RepID=UPI004059E0FD
MAELRFTILGCGSSGGVPRLGGHWGACDPENPKNTRTRCSMLVERVTEAGTTRILIDTSPDMRSQLLRAEVGTLDGVVFTHPHADHVHGLDDLRMIVFNMRQRLPVWADPETQDDLISRFGYAFVQPPNSSYPPILDLHGIDGPFEVPGAGGAINLTPFEVQHGRIRAKGFRISGLAYLPDVSEIPETSWEHLRDLDIWVVDALRRDPHPSHSHLENTLAWIEDAKPRQAVLTNMHIDLDYETVKRETPANVTPAFDGMQLTLPLPSQQSEQA